MKKPPVMFALSLLAVLTAAVSCSLTFDPPTKVRLKTDAVFAFTAPKIGEDNVVHYFDDIVKDSMAGQDDMQIFDYAPPAPEWGDVKAYLIRYKVEPIAFEIEQVVIDLDVDEITLIDTADNIEIPDEFTGGGIDFDSPMSWSGGGTLPIPSYTATAINLGTDITKVKMAEGTLSIGTPGDGFDYEKLTVKLDGYELQKKDGTDGRDHSLNDVELTGSPAISLSGSISAANAATLPDITPTISIVKFAEVVIQTKSDHTGFETSNIDLSGVPDGINYATFANISVDLQFMMKYDGESTSTSVRVDGLPVALDSPLLGFSVSGPPPFTGIAYSDPDNTGCKITGESDPLFVKTNRTLYFNATDYNASPKGPSDVLVDEDPSSGNTGIKVYVNPEIDGKHAEITLYNLKPGKIEVSVKPEVQLELDSVNVNLDTFVKASYSDPADTPLNGSFPGDEGLNMADMFDSMGVMGENIAFNRLDLYLYMDGDRELLEGTEFDLTAQTEAGGTGTKLAENKKFENLSSGTPPNFDAISDTVYSSTLANQQFYTEALVDVINDRPSNLQIDYDINLANHLQIDNANDLLTTGRDIEIRPELILVMPLQLRLIDEDGDGYGSMKLTESKPVANPGPGDDMFGRKGPDDGINDYLEQLGQVRLRVDYDNFMGLDGTSFYIVSKDFEGETNWEKSVTLREGAEQTLVLELGADDMTVYPFRPGLEIRVQNKGGENYGLIEIKRGGEETGGIWAKISIETDAHVDMAVDL